MGVWAFAYTLRKMTNEQLDADRPKMVASSARIDALEELAKVLAAEHREDEAAVQMLKQRAGRHPKDLRRAAARIRLAGWVDEDRTTFTANQLLLAAATDHSVHQVTLDQIRWFERIYALDEGSLEDSFRRIAVLDPGLANVESVIRRKLSDNPMPVGNDGPVKSIRHLKAVIAETLAPLVGPDAKNADPLVCSNTAHQIAESYLSAKFWFES